MKKRGLSTVVTTLIIILLVIVAVGIVWVVIRNLIENASGDAATSVNCLSINMEVENVECTGTYGREITLTLTSGQNVEGAKIVLMDGESNSASFDVDEPFETLESKKIVIESTEVDFDSTKVIVAPVLKDGDKEKICNEQSFVIDCSEGSGGTTEFVVFEETFDSDLGIFEVISGVEGMNVDSGDGVAYLSSGGDEVEIRTIYENSLQKDFDDTYELSADLYSGDDWGYDQVVVGCRCDYVDSGDGDRDLYKEAKATSGTYYFVRSDLIPSELCPNLSDTNILQSFQISVKSTFGKDTLSVDNIKLEKL